MRLDAKHRSWIFAVLTLAAVAVPSAFMVASFSSYRESATALTRAAELNGRIRHLDEVLTMSARMAAATGDPTWKERYDANVDDLTDAIGDMLALADSDAISAMVRATDVANNALIAMEDQALALAMTRRVRAAAALLGSAEYSEQKRIYADGMDRAMSAAHATFEREAGCNSNNLLLATTLSVLGVSLCFGAWFMLSQQSLKEQERLHAVARAERDAANSANAAKSLFLASMSHELRTPLNAIIGYSEMLQEGATEDARATDVADHAKVLGASRRLLGLINDVLDLSKAEAGKIDLKIEEFDACMMVESALSTIAPAANAGGNRLRADLAKSVGAVVNDEFRLAQCLLNLLSNAAKFTRNGEIVVRGRQERADGREWLVLSVCDTGIGMTDAQLADLFQPFVQGDADVARTFGGTGLGLAITRQLARLLGGDVEVASTLGEGSVFTLRVPVTWSHAIFHAQARAQIAA